MKCLRFEEDEEVDLESFAIISRSRLKSLSLSRARLNSTSEPEKKPWSFDTGVGESGRSSSSSSFLTMLSTSLISLSACSMNGRRDFGTLY